MNKPTSDEFAVYESIVDQLNLNNVPAVLGQMFGMPTIKLHGKGIAGFSKDAMVFKLFGEPHAKALALAEAELFDPMGGRPMKQWVVVPAAHKERWYEFALAAASSVEV